MTTDQPATRRRMPNDRTGTTHKFAIGAGEDRVKGYITANTYPDTGKLGEVFVKMSDQGSQISGFCDAWSIAVSMLLQSGTPVETIVKKFRGMAFEPEGMTGNPDIPIVKSPIDYVCRWLELRFVVPE